MNKKMSLHVIAGISGLLIVVFNVSSLFVDTYGLYQPLRDLIFVLPFLIFSHCLLNRRYSNLLVISAGLLVVCSLLPISSGNSTIFWILSFIGLFVVSAVFYNDILSEKCYILRKVILLPTLLAMLAAYFEIQNRSEYLYLVSGRELSIFDSTSPMIFKVRFLVMVLQIVFIFSSSFWMVNREYRNK